MRRVLMVLGLASAWVLSGCVAQALTSGRIVLRDDSAVSIPGFSANDRALIGGYYADPARRRDLTRRQATKREHLPGGLGQGDVLPTGLEGRALPEQLDRRLAPLPESYLRVIIGTDVVLFNRRTRVISDILRDIAR
ncbi:MAG: hypothetical protein ACYDDO_06075 [Acidiferrobacterales bacterium]